MWLAVQDLLYTIMTTTDIKTFNQVIVAFNNQELGWLVYLHHNDRLKPKSLKETLDQFSHCSIGEQWDIRNLKIREVYGYGFLEQGLSVSIAQNIP